MMEKQEMQEEDGLSTTKEAAGKSQGNGHKSQRLMAADPVLWIGILCSTSMCCAQCVGFCFDCIQTQCTHSVFCASFSCIIDSVFLLCQRDTKDMGSRSKSGTNHSPTPFLTSSFSSESISAIFRLCFLCLLLTMRFYLSSLCNPFYFDHFWPAGLLFLCLLICVWFRRHHHIVVFSDQLSPPSIALSCAAIITLMCATVMRGTISTMLTKANNAPRLESNAQKVPRALSRWFQARARAAGWGKSRG